MRWPWQPKHTFEDAVRIIVAGLEDGSIVLDKDAPQGDKQPHTPQRRTSGWLASLACPDTLRSVISVAAGATAGALMILVTPQTWWVALAVALGMVLFASVAAAWYVMTTHGGKRRAGGGTAQKDKDPAPSREESLLPAETTGPVRKE